MEYFGLTDLTVIYFTLLPTQQGYPNSVHADQTPVLTAEFS